MKALYPCEDNWDLLCEFYDRAEKISLDYEIDDEDVKQELIELIDSTERRIR